MKFMRFARRPVVSLVLNSVYACANCVMGLAVHSWWFITVGTYYVVLASARFCVLRMSRKEDRSTEMEDFAKRVCGLLLVVLSFCLVGVNVLSIVERRGTAYHEIIMIVMAVYSFAKLIFALIGMAKLGHGRPCLERILRNLSFADGIVSIYTLQRSMLVSFGGMTAADIQLMNMLTGTAVWFLVLLLGLNLIGGKYMDKMKSKLLKTNEKITETVTGGYKKIEQGVVDGYKKIEQGVVGGYARIEDKFIDAYLTKDGETVEEARERLRKERE